MDELKSGWFSELSDLWPGISLSLEIKNVLFKEKSQFQDVMILETKSHGRALILDGIIQCTESDEFSYQEMIAFLPLCSHPNPRKVLIVGGGDGGVAREVCKHPQVAEVDLVEIDSLVIEASKKYLPKLSIGFSHPKLTLHVDDGLKFMENKKNEYDVIITDSSDPVGPAVVLFQKNYFELMKAALRPNGVICSQGGTVWANIESLADTLTICKQVFLSCAFGYTCVPTYPTGQIGFVMGSLEEGKKFSEPCRILSEKELDSMNLQYYSPEIHRASFILPRFASKKFYKK